MIFSQTYTAQLEDSDKNGKLLPDGIMKLLMNAGNAQADTVKDDAIEDAQTGIGWLITDWRIRILRQPLHRETLTIHTWVNDVGRLSKMPRNYVILGEDGEEIVQAMSTFAKFDIAVNRIVRISQELLDAYAPDDRVLFTGRMRLQEPGEDAVSTEVVMRRGDVDFNSHVHNVPYLTYALEALPEEVYARDHYTGVRIFYKAPLHEGDPIQVTCARVAPEEAAQPVTPDTTDTYRMAIYGKDHTLCTLLEIDVGE